MELHEIRSTSWNKILLHEIRSTKSFKKLKNTVDDESKEFILVC